MGEVRATSPTCNGERTTDDERATETKMTITQAANAYKPLLFPPAWGIIKALSPTTPDRYSSPWNAIQTLVAKQLSASAVPSKTISDRLSPNIFRYGSPTTIRNTAANKPLRGRSPSLFVQRSGAEEDAALGDFGHAGAAHGGRGAGDDAGQP